jgi:hypothetical protein
VAEPTRSEHCELTFGEGLAMSDGGEVALEDYARVLTAAVRADAIRGDALGARVTAVRLLAPSSPPTADQHRDIEDFARGLAAEGGGLGLGWG